VFLRIVTALLGEDYAQQAPTSLLLNRDKNAATNDIARLRGARLVTAVETPEGRRLDENLAKQLTGGDKITARMLHKEFFEFTPVLKLWIATNHRPEIRGTDLAIWRRIRLVPFGVIVPEGDVDRDLGDKLEAELPGILAWAVAGCLAWQREGLRAPAAVVAATQAYRAEMDQIGRFIDERCQTGPASSVTAAVLFEAYRSWAADGGEHTVTARKFRDQLVERSFEYVKRGTDSASRLGNIWRGIGLLKLSEVVENRDS
jgi:putative DNA primase/helicase